MRKNPLTIDAEAKLAQAIEIIVEYKLTALTVTDPDGRPLGILSELDCLQSILAAIYNDGDPDHVLVKDAMSEDLQVCRSTDNIVEVAQSMLSSRQRRRPVVENGLLIGQVSSSNILWALMEHSRRKMYDGRQ